MTTTKTELEALIAEYEASAMAHENEGSRRRPCTGVSGLAPDALRS